MNFGYANDLKKKSFKTDIVDTQVLELFNSNCNSVIEEESNSSITNRPRLNQILKEIKPGDTFTITNLDSIAETIYEANEVINELISKGIKINILNVGIINSDSAELVKNIFKAIIEFESNILRQQENEICVTKERYKKAKYSTKKLDDALALLTINGGHYSYNEVVAITGISRSTLLREQKKRKI